jgi:hypothetical protein
MTTTTAKPAAAAPLPPDAPPADGKPLFPTSSAPLPMRPLAKGRLKLICASACSYGNLHGAVLPAGTPFEHVFSEDFWRLWWPNARLRCIYSLQPSAMPRIQQATATWR